MCWIILFCAPGGIRHKLIIRFTHKYLLPRLGDKHSLCSSCIPPPSFESCRLLQNKSCGVLTHPTPLFCAPGRIRTCVARRALDLQSSAIDHSATDAWYTASNCTSVHHISYLYQYSDISIYCTRSRYFLRLVYTILR